MTPSKIYQNQNPTTCVAVFYNDVSLGVIAFAPGITQLAVAPTVVQVKVIAGSCTFAQGAVTSLKTAGDTIQIQRHITASVTVAAEQMCVWQSEGGTQGGDNHPHPNTK